jgi:hypothetical protein
MTVLTMQFFSAYGYFLPLHVQIFSSLPVSKHSQSMFLSQCDTMFYNHAKQQAKLWLCIF